MDVIIEPNNKIIGHITAPPSKSYTHRYLFLGLLSRYVTRLLNPLICDDTVASIEAIKAFGADYRTPDIRGVDRPRKPDKEIDCRRSGTTCRFATAIASMVRGPIVLTGSEQLSRRPMKQLIDALRQIGVEILDNNGHLPIVINGGKIKNREVTISGKISSQFISALILLGSKIGIKVIVEDEMVSKGYIDITLRTLEEAGARLYIDRYKYFEVFPSDLKGGERIVPGDYSSAAFFIAAAAIGGRVTINGLEKNDVQPDKKILEIVREMGAIVKWRNNEVEVSHGELTGIEIDCRDTPDLIPIVSVLGAYANGTTIISGGEHARYKETDRIKTTTINLRKMGVNAIEKNDGLVIYGGKRLGQSPAYFNSFGDHRIAMAFIIAALFHKKPCRVYGVEVIRDSYPEFFTDLSKVGGRFRIV